MPDPFYCILFVILVLAAVAFEYCSGSSFFSAIGPEGLELSPSFKAFRNNYLLVYSLMMAGDWLQGPYIYALYEHYGYKVGDIGLLFIAGFGSSMIFGTIAGALADKYGRRLASLMYAITYSLSCITKHSADFNVLLLGRLLGGISTSLLFSAFESWLVAEHTSNSYSNALLGDIFSKSVFLGAGLMAILSGLLGNVLVEELKWGPVASFDAAIAVMLCGAVVIMTTWGENYGRSSAGGGLIAQFKHATIAIIMDPKVYLLGGMQSMFEAAMYTFVFLWTPSLSPDGERIPHGIVFACFMTACMVGSAITGLLMKRVAVESYMVTVFGISALSMVVPFVFHLDHRNPNSGSSLVDNNKGGITLAGQFQLIAFCLFEGCVGIFWPSMMSMRARYVPEDVRSTVINLFRIPLNLFVCLMLLKVSDFPLSVMFALCCALLGSCMLCQMALNVFIAGEAAELLEKQNSSCPHGTGGDIYATAKVSSAMKVSNSSGSLGGDTKLAVNVPHQR